MNIVTIYFNVENFSYRVKLDDNQTSIFKNFLASTSPQNTFIIDLPDESIILNKDNIVLVNILPTKE